MEPRDASDVNAEFARLMAETAKQRSYYSASLDLPEQFRKETLRLMQETLRLGKETERLAKWDRWVLPLSMVSLTFSVITLCLVWNR
jgi:hypothetical protein